MVSDYLLIGFSLLTSALVLFAIYMKTTTGMCLSKRDLTGKTVIVTGANTGIGFETAKDLASRNARVILACRTISTAERALKEIVVSTGNDNLVVRQLDLGSFESIRAFAKEILASERRLDILVNNAGISSSSKLEKTIDGLETVMATNHFGPFLLTHLLLPLLEKSIPSRVVNVSSWMHELFRMDFDNLNAEKSFSGIHAYGMSKLANVLFANELSERMEGTGVTANALNPGTVRTNIIRNASWFVRSLFGVLGLFFLKSASDGAQTSIYVAVAEELEGVSGKYFSDCAEKKLKEHARDSNSAKRLWLVSEKITGLSLETS